MKFFILKSITIASFVALLSCGNNVLEADSNAEETTEQASEMAPEQSTAPHEEVTVESFNQTIADSKVTLVDFYTTWCGPCKAMAPFVAQIKADYADKANVLSVDAEKLIALSEKYNINAYPTIIYFKNGVPVASDLGYQTYDQLKNRIDALSK